MAHFGLGPREYSEVLEIKARVEAMGLSLGVNSSGFDVLQEDRVLASYITLDEVVAFLDGLKCLAISQIEAGAKPFKRYLEALAGKPGTCIVCGQRAVGGTPYCSVTCVDLYEAKHKASGEVPP